MSRVTRHWALERGFAAGHASVAPAVWAVPADDMLALRAREALAAAAIAYMKEYEVPGLSVAIARCGRLT